MKTTTDKTDLVPDHELDDVTCMESIPYYCDDCETWHQSYHGLQVEGGEIVLASCDTDGDWDFDGEGIVATPDACDIEWRKLAEEGAQARANYDQHCLETGTDPLGEYYVRRYTTTTHDVVATLQKHVAMPEHGPRITHMTVDGEEVDPTETLQSIKDYYQVETRAGHTVCGETDSEFWDSCDWSKSGTLVHTESIEHKTPRGDADVAADIRAIVERSIARREVA